MMFKNYWKLLKDTGVSPYIWTVLAILPFYFISQSPSTVIIAHWDYFNTLIFSFLPVCFVLLRGGLIYLWTCSLLQYQLFDNHVQLCLFCFFSCLFDRKYKGKAHLLFYILFI